MCECVVCDVLTLLLCCWMHAQHSRRFWLLAVGIIQCLREYSHRKEAIATNTMHHLINALVTTVTLVQVRNIKYIDLAATTCGAGSYSSGGSCTNCPAGKVLPPPLCCILLATYPTCPALPFPPIPLSAAVPRRWRPGWRLYRLRSWQVQWCSRRQLLLHLLPQEELLRGWLLVARPVPCWHLRQQRWAG